MCSFWGSLQAVDESEKGSRVWRRHRLLGDLAFSLVKIRGGTVEFTADGRPLLVEGARFFGPAAQIGHRYTADGGFTTLGTIGVGYAVGDVREGDRRLNLVASVGAGLSF